MCSRHTEPQVEIPGGGQVHLDMVGSKGRKGVLGHPSPHEYFFRLSWGQAE